MNKNDDLFLFNAKELRDFLFLIGLDIVAELELTNGSMHKCFCEGELYLIDRIKEKLWEMENR